MGKTQATRAKELLIILKNENKNKLEFEEFKLEIKKYIGSDMERTVKPYFNLMNELKLIESKEEEGIKNVYIL